MFHPVINILFQYPVYLALIGSVIPLILLFGSFITIIILFIIYNYLDKKITKKGPTYTNPYDEPYRDENLALLSSYYRMSIGQKVDELNKDLEPFGFAYYEPDDLFYSNMECWQRNCGYCRLYDEACAPLSMVIDSDPIYFEYDNRRWLIEMWKGQYGLNTGCEIGVYSTSAPNLDIPGIFNGTLYECVKNDELLLLGFTLIKNNKVIMARRAKHWWLTGFKLGEFTEPEDLIMNCEITLKDQDMLNAFLGGLQEAGYNTNEYSVKKLTVSIVFNKPHTSQPVTRNELIDSIMQTNNRNNCEAYEQITKKYGNTLDKINIVKLESPKLYRKITNVANTTDMFKSFATIKEYTAVSILEDDNKDDVPLDE
jgi:hypothetical protein